MLHHGSVELVHSIECYYTWDKELKNGPSKICGRQPLKNFTWFVLDYFVPYLHILFWHFFDFRQKNVCIYKFIYLFDEVLNLRNRILINQKPE